VYKANYSNSIRKKGNFDTYKYRRETYDVLALRYHCWLSWVRRQMTALSSDFKKTCII
jgi:hypothetical protein